MRARNSPLVGRVYEAVKQDILMNHLQPGEPLLEEELAGRLAVSRTPIREALRRLDHEGLIRVVPNKGAFVRVLTPKDIREIYEVREALESFAAGRAAMLLSKKEIERFSTLAQSLGRRKPKLGYRHLRDAWEALRQTVIAAAANDRVNSILATINDQIEAARHYSSAPPGRIEELLSDFVSVVRALQDRDSTRAARAVRDHLRKSKGVLLEMFGDGAKSGQEKLLRDKRATVRVGIAKNREGARHRSV